MEGVEYTDVLEIGVIMALVELLKFMNVPKKALPIASLVFGVVGDVFYLFPGDIKVGILTGLFKRRIMGSNNVKPIKIRL